MSQNLEIKSVESSSVKLETRRERFHRAAEKQVNIVLNALHALGALDAEIYERTKEDVHTIETAVTAALGTCVTNLGKEKPRPFSFTL